MKKMLLFLLLAWIYQGLWGQNTVGLLSHEESKAYPGYNLFFPHNQPNTYLIDNCGRIVHTWPDSADIRPGNLAYLMEDGRLIKGKRKADVSNDPIFAGGGGETIEILDWDNNLLYSYTLNDSSARLHHDFAPMPNGNILAIAWEYISESEALQAGRNPATMTEGELWPDMIIEIDPLEDSIVWKWRAWDHLIQDFDSTKDNFGVVGDHPELIDLNLDTNFGFADWLHANALDYNPELDQIVISIPQFDEIWIIDHSATIEEAAGHSGGNSGMGGDLIYRWGNPSAYRAGGASDQRLQYQHDIHWIDDLIPASHPNYGKLALFNNQVGPDLSTVDIVVPTFDTLNQSYAFQNGKYLPENFDVTLKHPTPSKMWSTGLSGVQLLPNDNYLVTAGRFGYNFEITPDQEIVWEYVTPVKKPNIATQGDSLVENDNLTFRMKRFPMDFPAFQGKDLSPKGWLELQPNTSFCGSITLNNERPQPTAVQVYPNPASDYLIVEGELRGKIALFNTQGQQVISEEAKPGRTEISLREIQKGMYFLKMENGFSQKVLIQ